MKDKILVSLDGAEESLVTAWLLKKQGFTMRAVTFDITEVPEHKEALRRSVAEYERKLGISIQILDCAREAREIVEREVAQGSERGFRYDIKTIFHQRFLFPKLLAMKDHFNFDKVATGHRVNVHFEPIDNQVSVVRYPTKADDESHLLVGLTQKELRCLEFPLGSIPKAMIHKLADELKLGVEGASKLAKFEVQHEAHVKDSLIYNTEGAYEGTAEMEELSLGSKFVESVVFDILPGQNQIVVGHLEDRTIREIWFENASWFSGEDLGFKIKNCLMSWKHEAQPVPVKIMQYEGSGLKVLCEQPLTGENANLFSGDNVVWLEGETVLGGARVVQCL